MGMWDGGRELALHSECPHITHRSQKGLVCGTGQGQTLLVQWEKGSRPNPVVPKARGIGTQLPPFKIAAVLPYATW